VSAATEMEKSGRLLIFMPLNKRVSVENLDFARVLSMPNLSNRYEDRQEDVDAVVYSREHQSSGGEIQRTVNVGASRDSQACPERLAVEARLKFSGR
jgi:hypothetical protein